MSDVWIMVMFSVVVWLMTALVVAQAFWRKKYGGKLWDVYQDVARELGLTLSEESSAPYGLPDVIGTIRDHRVFIHPIVGRGAGGLAKTAYAVEHKLSFEGKVAVSSAQISRWKLGMFRCSLDVPNLRGKYNVSSESPNNQDVMNRLFTADLTTRFDSLVSRDTSNFFSLILESGGLFFYTLDWEEDKEKLRRNLLDAIDLAEQMEKNAPTLYPTLENETFKRLAKRTPRKGADICMMVVVAILGVILLLLPVLDPAFLSVAILVVNFGLALILMSVTRVYAATRMKPREAS